MIVLYQLDYLLEMIEGGSKKIMWDSKNKKGGEGHSQKIEYSMSSSGSKSTVSLN